MCVSLHIYVCAYIRCIRAFKFFSFFFFFNDTATTEIYTLSLHDALPISFSSAGVSKTMPKPDKCTRSSRYHREKPTARSLWMKRRDRKSTRLNSSHQIISYAVFCLKKKKINNKNRTIHIFKNLRHSHYHILK